MNVICQWVCCFKSQVTSAACRNHSDQDQRTKEGRTNKRRTEYNIDPCLRVGGNLVRTRDRRSACPVRIGMVRTQVHVRARDAFDALDICVNDCAAEEVEVQIVLCVFVFVSCSDPRTVIDSRTSS